MFGGGHIGAAAWAGFEKTFLFELVERVTQGVAGDAEVFGEGARGRQTLESLESAVLDGPPEFRCDV